VVIRTPDQRLRVFVSSSLGELAAERRAVAVAVSGLGLSPVLFESGARPYPPAEVYRAYLAQCDVFVGVYWQEYGWVAPGMVVSGLEDEFNLSGGLPRLLYVKAPAPDQDGRLADLLSRVESEGAASYRVFSSPGELGRLVRDDLAVLMSERFASSGLAAAGGDAARLAEPAGLPAAAEVSVSIAPPARHLGGRLPLRGREALLAGLTGAGAGGRVLVVHGMGGCGKTSLAAEAAHRLGRRGAEVWWVTATDADRLAAGMRAVGRRLGIAGEELGRADVADVVWQRLGTLRQEWLLVVDDADEPLVLAGPDAQLAEGTGWLRPAPPGGLVLVTSRDGRAASWGPWCDLLPVGMLGTDDAVGVLADHAGSWHAGLGGDVEARLLADRLGRLPLALRIAGSYLAESAAVPAAFAGEDLVRGYRQYRTLIDSQLVTSPFPAPDAAGSAATRARSTIGRTWELTLDQLEARGMPEARRLLRLLACFADAPIPHELLLNPVAMARSRLFAGVTGPRLWQLLQTLAGFGLIDILDGPGRTQAMLRMHALVRDTGRQAHGSDAERQEYQELTARLLATAADSGQMSDMDEQAAQPQIAAMAPHALHVFHALTTRPATPGPAVLDAATAANVTARWQAAQGLIQVAEATHDAVLRLRLQALGPDHPDTIDARYQIARAARHRGDHAFAEAEYRQVADARARVLGPDHADTLEARHNIAAAMSFQGRYHDAEAQYRRVLAEEEKALSRDHRLRLATRHEVARMIGEQGRYVESESEFRAILTDWLRLYGPDHPGTLNARRNIALMKAAQGQHAAAEAQLRDILIAQQVISGPDHPRTFLVRSNIARTLADQGRYAAAEAEYRDIAQAMQRVLIADHPDLLEVRHEISRAMAAQGNHAAAISELADVLTARTRILGPAHPQTTMTARELEAIRQP
jgi:tetratricopeptide (TPR) repeat protein